MVATILVLTAFRFWFEFRDPFFDFFLSYFFILKLVWATISLSFDWLSIRIRVSKIRFSIFFLNLVWETRLVFTAVRFWFEFRLSVFIYFSFFSSFFILKLAWEQQQGFTHRVKRTVLLKFSGWQIRCPPTVYHSVPKNNDILDSILVYKLSLYFGSKWCKILACVGKQCCNVRYYCCTLVE